MSIAKIYKPCNTPTQSGFGKDCWILEFFAENTKYKEPLMGWTGNQDTKTQVLLKFKYQEKAQEYAKKMKIDFVLELPKKRKIKPKSYADNFK